MKGRCIHLHISILLVGHYSCSCVPIPADVLVLCLLFVVLCFHSILKASASSVFRNSGFGLSCICFIRLAVSMAVTAASDPLLPAFPPALSKACSMVSQVRTPKIQGTRVLRPAVSVPFVAAPATES